MKNKINYEKSKKIKSQKNAALLLIFIPMIMLIMYLSKNDIDKYGMNGYFLCGASFVLMIIGGIGLKNSLQKQRELHH